MKKIVLLLFTLVFVIAAMFTGCAQKEGEQASAAASAGTESSEVASADTGSSEAAGFDGQIKIGVSIPITGNYAEHGKGLLAAAELALEDINASGGILGKELVLDIEDSASDPTVSAENARKFVEDEEIVLCMGDYASGQTLAMCPICQEGGLPEITPSSSSADIPKTGDYIFALVGTQPDEQAYNAKYIFQKYLGAQKVGIIYVNNDWGKAILTNLEAGCAAVGLEFETKEAIAEGDKDFSAILSKVKQEGPDAIFLGTQINETANIVNQMAQSGYSSEVDVLISGGSYSDQLLELIGDNGDGMYITMSYFISEEDTRGLAFQERFQEQSGGLSPNVMTAGMYDGLMIAKEAIERAQSADRAAIKDALALTQNFDGITGTISFDETGTNHRQYMILGIENSKWVSSRRIRLHE